ncbi:MAG TPA: sugar phosphate isomerase/epimerase family protein [Gemmataceae bacterium]|jgi:3-dehydroshikimate dehydratase|nr:sugar phosphate isomerase/epimerase family protein [Gemmataceae bacterium]
MFTLSAFADEISPEPNEQVAVLKACGVHHIEFRSIYKTNVLALSEGHVREFKALLDDEGFKLSAIGSPIGKVRIDEPFGPHLDKFRRAIDIAKLFGTPNIRIFSYYPPDDFDGNWAPFRDEVMSRMRQKVEIAEREDIQLFHENEHRIYGDSPERLADLFASVKSPKLKAAFDPANFVFCGYDPLKGWEASKAHTAHFHVKDWKAGEEHGSIPGEGGGQFPKIIAEAVKMGYRGFATMEPHLLGGGPTGGVTGPELFPKAVAAFRQIVEAAGGRHQ